MTDKKFPYTEEGVKEMSEYLQDKILQTDCLVYESSKHYVPVILLAGAPGAGKTEWIESFPNVNNYIILDTDLYRSLFEGYNGSNADEFHKYASWVMDRMFTFCLKNKYNMIVDGTFANSEKALENIVRCEKKGMAYSIILVIQDPIISYLYTKKREIEKLRNVPTKVFIEKFYKSIASVREILLQKKDPLIFLTKKLKSNPKFSDTQVKNIEQFDRLTNYEYTIDELDRIITDLKTDCETQPLLISKLLGLLPWNK